MLYVYSLRVDALKMWGLVLPMQLPMFCIVLHVYWLILAKKRTTV